MGNDGPSAYDRMVTDGDTGQNHGVGSHPDISADFNGRMEERFPIRLDGKVVRQRGDGHMACNERVISDADPSMSPDVDEGVD